VQGALAEAIVGRAIIGAVVRHCLLGFVGDWTGEKGVNAARRAVGRDK
jgi:hypothetical protein